MFFTVSFKKIIFIVGALALAVCIVALSIHLFTYDKYYVSYKVNSEDLQVEENTQNSENIEKPKEEVVEKKYIKWVDYSVPCSVMQKALNADIKSQGSTAKLNWIELLAYLSAKYGGNYKLYKASDLDNLTARLSGGENIQEITKNMKYYNYYLEAYNAILGGFVGNYKIQIDNKETGEKEWKENYGLKVFSPVARGYNFSHCHDFGNGRSFGYKRKHLGNDLMGSIGTPIVAMESGNIEVLGWNIYGGWRVGIRSFDKKRYYYYAHLKKDHPYNKELIEGQTVKSGDVIGYLGMTGYSRKENVNNINVPHLHFGLQLIFDESQKDGVNQIWIDVYDIIELLQKSKSPVYRDASTKDFYRVYDFYDSSIPE